MKNYAFISMLFCALILGGFVKAQPGIGVIGGLNFANLRASGVDTNIALDYNTRLGFKAGVVLEVPFSDKAGLRFEPMFLEKGSEKTTTVAGEPGHPFTLTSTMKLSYLEFPVLFQYRFGKGKVQPYLLGGAAASVLLKAREKFEAGPLGPGQETDVKDNYKNTDVELTGGAGMNIPLGRGSLFVEGRYSHGLTNLNAVTESPVKLYNQGIQIMGGVMIPLGERRSPVPPPVELPGQQADVCDCQSLILSEPVGFSILGNQNARPQNETVQMAISVMLKCDRVDKCNCTGTIAVMAGAVNNNVEGQHWVDGDNKGLQAPNIIMPRNNTVEFNLVCSGQALPRTGKFQFQFVAPKAEHYKGPIDITFELACIAKNVGNGKVDPNNRRVFRLMVDTSKNGKIDHANSDLDGDGLDGKTEASLHTKPNVWDTNKNGISDGDEDADGDGVINRLDGNPLNPEKQ